MLTHRFFRYVQLQVILMSAVFSVTSLAAEGGLRLTQTRVVFNGGDNSAKVAIKNNSEQVYLVKVDVMNTQEGNADMPAPPFLVTPPLSRLEALSQNTSLVVRNGAEKLPNDRESVFYLSFLAIPSTKKWANSDENMTSAQVSVGVRNVIKLFYRPANLPITVEQAARKLTFSQKGQQLKVTNPTPYYLTLAQLKTDQHGVDLRNAEPMLAPFSTRHYSVHGKVTQAQWAVIGDFGNMSQMYQATVQTGAEDVNP